MSVEIDGVNNIIKADTISEVTSANGVTIDGLTIKDGGITATTGAIIFNEDSADVDFRVESNGSTHAIFVDGGNDVVGINTVDPSASWVGANNLVISDTSSDGGMTIISGTSGNGNIMFSDAQAGAFSDARGLITYLHNGDAMRFITANAEAMRITEIGAVTKPLQPAFLVTPASDQTSLDNNDTIVFGTEIFDQNADFASNTFTAPVTGRYLLSFALRLELIQENTTYALFSLVTSNRSYQNIFDSSTSDSTIDFRSFTMSILADMDANDTVTVVFGEAGGSTGQTRVSEAESFFSGVLVC